MALWLLDIFFTALHLGVILFNLLGWIPRRTRRLHRWCVGLTALSWYGAGLVAGNIGYCPLTDWHWRIKKLRGVEELPPASFITWLFNRAGFYPSPAQVDLFAGTIFGLIIIITLALWWRERRGESDDKNI